MPRPRCCQCFIFGSALSEAVALSWHRSARLKRAAAPGPECGYASPPPGVAAASRGTVRPTSSIRSRYGARSSTKQAISVSQTGGGDRPARPPCRSPARRNGSRMRPCASHAADLVQASQLQQHETARDGGSRSSALARTARGQGPSTTSADRSRRPPVQPRPHDAVMPANRKAGARRALTGSTAPPHRSRTAPARRCVEPHCELFRCRPVCSPKVKLHKPHRECLRRRHRPRLIPTPSDWAPSSLAGLIAVMLGLVIGSWLAWLGLLFTLLCLSSSATPSACRPAASGRAARRTGGDLGDARRAPCRAWSGRVPRWRVSTFLSVARCPREPGPGRRHRHPHRLPTRQLHQCQPRQGERDERAQCLRAASCRRSRARGGADRRPHRPPDRLRSA